MTWQRLDDSFYRNSKQLRLSDAAFRLLVCSWSYCADQRQLTGFMTTEQGLSLARSLKKSRRTIAELLQKGSWEEVVDGYLIHDYEEYVEVGSRDRVRRWRDRKRLECGSNSNVTGNAEEASPRTRARAPVPVPVPVPVVGDEVTPSVDYSYPPVIPPPNGASGAKAQQEVPERVLQRWHEACGGRRPTADDERFAQAIPFAFDRLSAGEVLDEVDRLVGKFHDKPLPPLKYLAGRLQDLNAKASENGRTSRHSSGKPGMASMADVLAGVRRRAG